VNTVTTNRGGAHLGPRGPVAGWSLTARAFNAVGWSYLSGFVLLLAQVAYTAFTARLIAPRWFGGYALALTIVAFAGLFGSAGLANAVMRTQHLSDRGARTALTLAVASGLVISVAMVVLAAPIEKWFHAPGAAGALRLLAFQPPMLAAAGVTFGLLRRQRRYRAASLIDVGSSLAGFAVGAVAIVSGMGVIGLSVGQVARGVVAMAVGLLAVRVSLRPACEKASAREFVGFSAQVTGQNVGHYAIGNLPLWSVARLAGGAATGLFSRGYQLVALPNDQFTSGLIRALYPLYREVRTGRDHTQRALTEGLVLTSGAAFLIFGAFAALVQPAALLLLGPRWYAATAVTPLLCAFAAVNTLYSVLASAAEAMRWMRMIWITQLLFFVSMGAALYAASGRLELTAAAMVLATAVAHLYMLLWVSREGLLLRLEVVRAYAIHAALGLVFAIVPVLISQATVGRSVLPALGVRAAVLALLGLALWLLRNWVPGLRLGLVRLREFHPPRRPGRHSLAGSN